MYSSIKILAIILLCSFHVLVKGQNVIHEKSDLHTLWKLNQLYIENNRSLDTTALKLRYGFSDENKFIFSNGEHTNLLEYAVSDVGQIDIKLGSQVVFSLQIIHLDTENLILEGKTTQGRKVEYRFKVDYDFIQQKL